MCLHEHREKNPFRVFCISASLLSFLLILLAIQTPHPNLIYAETNPKTRVYGYVFDYATHKPLAKAQISAINRSVSWWRSVDLTRLWEQQKIIAETNGSGFFEAYLDSFGWYTFFAHCDNLSTPGIDYVPAYWEANLADQQCYISFSLLPGASLIATDDPFFLFEDQVFSCSVMDERGLLELTKSVKDWWELRSVLGNRTVMVPANTAVKIEVDTYKILETSYGRWNLQRTAHFSIPQGGYLNLTQGEQIALDLRKARLEIESTLEMPRRFNLAESLANKIGILSSYEKMRISTAGELLRRGQDSVSIGDYVAAQADLSESYIILADVEEGLRSLFQNSAFSICFITPFMGVTSSSLGAIFSKDRRRRIVISIVLYIFLVVVLYYAYPGYTFVQDPSYNPLAGTFLESLVIPLLLVFSLALGLFLINVPYTYGEVTDRSRLSLRSAIVATFSLAVDNLKRRKLRSFLTMSFMLISVFAFIVTTSYSYEAGFVVRQVKGSSPGDGIFVFQQAVNRRVMPFGPVETQVIQWSRNRSEVALAVPLLENIPQMGTPPPPLGVLSNADSSLNYSVSGVLGVEPILEANLTKIDQIIDPEATAGRFLNEMDINGIVISQEAKEALHVSLNDTVTFCNGDFTVIGVFDSGKLGGLRDLNGDPIVPQQVEVLLTMGGPVYLPSYVAPERVVIVLGEVASELPLNIVVSRVNVQTRRSEDMFPLARALVLIFPRVEAFVSMGDQIQHLYVGHYEVVQGFGESTVLLALMVLNVGIMMLNVVYERRREVITMSTIGMNPSQITVIFACEALVMAFISGSLGYLLGLTSYSFLGLFPSRPILKYKVEPFWSILALCFSISASVLGSIVPASKASIMATPSLLRRFIITPKERSEQETWTLDVPIKVKERDLRRFYDFMEDRFKVFHDPLRFEERVDNLARDEKIFHPSRERLYFVYKYSVDKIITENELFAVKDIGSDEYFIRLSSKSLLPRTIMGKEASARQTASFIRRLTLEYTERRRI